VFGFRSLDPAYSYALADLLTIVLAIAGMELIVTGGWGSRRCRLPAQGRVSCIVFSWNCCLPDAVLAYSAHIL
jgi:hypothetical protein